MLGRIFTLFKVILAVLVGVGVIVYLITILAPVFGFTGSTITKYAFAARLMIYDPLLKLIWGWVKQVFTLENAEVAADTVAKHAPGILGNSVWVVSLLAAFWLFFSWVRYVKTNGWESFGQSVSGTFISFFKPVGNFINTLTGVVLLYGIYFVYGLLKNDDLFGSEGFFIMVTAIAICLILYLARDKIYHLVGVVGSFVIMLLLGVLLISILAPSIMAQFQNAPVAGSIVGFGTGLSGGMDSSIRTLIAILSALAVLFLADKLIDEGGHNEEAHDEAPAPEAAPPPARGGFFARLRGG